MALTRRAFLHRASSLLAGLGISEASLSLLGNQYQQALAQPTRRKLALLVGINQYRATQMPALAGCLTDVDLQRELLRYRFHFQDSDILVLTNQDATRNNIETAFISHLVEQVRPGDVVVFHFSGYGRHIRLPARDGTSLARLEQNTLIPVDGGVPSNPALSKVDDLLEDTLFLLLRSLQTEQITTIIDAGSTYPDSAWQGNLQIRARPEPIEAVEPAVAEVALQEQLIRSMDVSWEQLTAQLRSRQLPGVVLAAAGPGALATEAYWPGFNAGLFTYALTQHLWSTTPATLQISFSQTTSSVQQFAGKEQPELSGQKRQGLLPAYNLSPGSGAEGAVIAIANNGKTGRVWLAGLPLEVLTHYGAGSILTLVPSPQTVKPLSPSTVTAAPEKEVSGQPVPAPSPDQPIQLNNIHGLCAQFGVIPDPQGLHQGGAVPGLSLIGQQVHEAIRVMPDNISFTLALDSSLERIERVDATSAFSDLPQLSSVISTEQPADYLFAKVTTLSSVAQPKGVSLRPTLPESSVSKSSYGLFTLGGDLLPGTAGEVGEAIKSAVRRLLPKFKALHGTKLLNSTLNEQSSRLGVSATLETTAPQQQILARQRTLRAPWLGSEVAASPLPIAGTEGKVLSLPVGTRIQYRVHNYSDRPVYLLVLGVDSSVNAFGFYPAAFTASNPEAALQNAVISAGDTLVLPQVSGPFEWIIPGPAGLRTTYFMLSRQPFTKALAVLEPVLRENNESLQIFALPNLLEVARAVLQDLYQASLPASEAFGLKGNALDVNVWSTLRFRYRVI